MGKQIQMAFPCQLKSKFSISKDLSTDVSQLVKHDSGKKNISKYP